ncbi:CUB domain protein [Paragonimus heterotremus]|uniref:CUB domain protein n=1 Tax=Paragonimus heterotremus TaxID=100268 RepID=A0A8J4WMF6_9TREM|nr:CUB domain protein [Paragonimus heterotremus]
MSTNCHLQVEEVPVDEKNNYFISDCSFNFYATDSLVGEFTSPNYPGLYPAEIICDYKLIGRANEVILLQFIEFDVESSSHACPTDGSGDYVELRACSLSDFLNIPKMRYCQTRPKEQQIIIRWNKPCLVIRFFSNPFITRKGFFASYSFQKAGNYDFFITECFTTSELCVVSLCDSP